MTDLTKGIIDIDGYEINPNTTPQDIETYLSGRYWYGKTSPSGNTTLFSFRDVKVGDYNFDLDIDLYKGKMNRIKFMSTNEERLTYEELFVV